MSSLWSAAKDQDNSGPTNSDSDISRTFNEACSGRPDYLLILERDRRYPVTAEYPVCVSERIIKDEERKYSEHLE